MGVSVFGAILVLPSLIFSGVRGGQMDASACRRHKHGVPDRGLRARSYLKTADLQRDVLLVGFLILRFFPFVLCVFGTRVSRAGFNVRRAIGKGAGVGKKIGLLM